jgi:hypothetical protein
VLAEQGLLGVVLWVLMLVSVATWLRSRPPQPRTIGIAMLGGLIIGCMFLSPPVSLQTSVLPAIVLTAALVGNWSGGSRGAEMQEQTVVREAGRRSVNR